MKILLAIIITATFSFGCAMLEGEQTTTDTGGVTTSPAPTGGGDSTPTVAAESSVGGQRISVSKDDRDGVSCAIKADNTVQCWGSNIRGKVQFCQIWDLSQVSSSGTSTSVQSKLITQSSTGEIIILGKVLSPLI